MYRHAGGDEAELPVGDLDPHHAAAIDSTERQSIWTLCHSHRVKGPLEELY